MTKTNVTYFKKFDNAEDLEKLIKEFKSYARKEDQCGQSRNSVTYYHKQACQVLNTIKERFNAEIHQGVDCVIVRNDAFEIMIKE